MPGCDEPLLLLLLEGCKWRKAAAFLALGLPGGVMLMLEASSFDITTALAGRLGTIAVDAHTILLTVVGGACPADPAATRGTCASRSW